MFGRKSQGSREVQIVPYESKPLPITGLFPERPASIQIGPGFELNSEQHARSGLFYGLKGFLVRLLPLLVLWSGLAAAVIWHFGSVGPWMFLGFAVLTAVLLLMLRRQDYANSPHGVLREALKAQERVIEREHKLRERAMKRGWQ